LALSASRLRQRHLSHGNRGSACGLRRQTSAACQPQSQMNQPADLFLQTRSPG
jgi:hypothetical protein